MLRPLAARIAVCIAAALALTAMSASEQLVVIRSTSPAYAPGTVIQQDATVKLPEGQEIEVISPKGNRSTFKGPHNGPVAARGRKIRSESLRAVGDAVFGKDIPTAVLGATRRIPRPEEDNVPPYDYPKVLVDVMRDTTQCVFEDARIILRRPAPEGRAKIHISSVNGGQSVSLIWPALDVDMAWPSELEIEDGDQFRIVRATENLETPKLTGNEWDEENAVAHPPVMVTFKSMTPRENPIEATIQYATLGCSDQAKRVADGISRAASAEGG